MPPTPAEATTWLFVTMSPVASHTTPEPSSPPWALVTEIATTAGEAAWATFDQSALETTDGSALAPPTTVDDVAAVVVCWFVAPDTARVAPLPTSAAMAAVAASSLQRRRRRPGAAPGEGVVEFGSDGSEPLLAPGSLPSRLASAAPTWAALEAAGNPSCWGSECSVEAGSAAVAGPGP